MATDHKGPGHNRDHNFIMEKKSHWEGSEVHPTLNQSFNTGGIGYSNQELFSQGGSGLVQAMRESGQGYWMKTEAAGTIDANMGCSGHSNRPAVIGQAIPIHDQATRNAGKRGDKQDGKGNGLGVGKPGDPCPTLTKGDKHAVLYENHPNDSRVTGPHEVAPACVSRFGTGGGNVPLVQEAVVGQVDWRTANSDNANVSQTLKTDLAHQSGPCLVFQESELRLTGKITEQKVVPTLKAGTKGGDTEPKVVAIEPGKLKRLGTGVHKDIAPCLKADSGDNSPAVSCDLYNQTTNEHVSQTLRSGATSAEHVGGVIHRMAVRRLTPKECERLQGFPDDHTLIPWRNKPADQCPDGPRYKALGNSMAVPCMAWIGKRIAKAEHERQGAA